MPQGLFPALYCIREIFVPGGCSCAYDYRHSHDIGKEIKATRIAAAFAEPMAVFQNQVRNIRNSRLSTSIARAETSGPVALNPGRRTLFRCMIYRLSTIACAPEVRGRASWIRSRPGIDDAL